MYADHSGSISIPRFSDRLPIVHSFYYSHQPSVLLNVPCKAVEMPGSLVTRQGTPCWVGRPGSSHSSVHILSCSLGCRSQHLAVGWALGLVLATSLGLCPGVVYEEAEVPVM